MGHTIEYADLRKESFMHDLASAMGGYRPSKRLQVEVILEPLEMKYFVRIGGFIEYEGNSLKDAIATYNKFN